MSRAKREAKSWKANYDKASKERALLWLEARGLQAEVERLRENLKTVDSLLNAREAEAERLREEQSQAWNEVRNNAHEVERRLAGENERLRAERDKANIAAREMWDYLSKDEAEQLLEVERLRADNEQHLKQWTQDVERLRAENRLLQAEIDGAPLGWHSKEEA